LRRRRGATRGFCCGAGFFFGATCGVFFGAGFFFHATRGFFRSGTHHERLAFTVFALALRF
jgi:hypothetical protein